MILDKCQMHLNCPHSCQARMQEDFHLPMQDFIEEYADYFNCTHFRKSGPRLSICNFRMWSNSRNLQSILDDESNLVITFD